MRHLFRVPGHRALCGAAVAGLLFVTLAASARAAFVNFESGQVRPLALSPERSLLFATNTPDNRLAVFRIDAAGLTLAAELAVGLEPLAVAARTNREGALDVWVVNHLSDNVSIVRVDPLDPRRSRVVATLQVGDEPRDVVFGGSGRNRAFVTTARRGQNLPASVPARLDTPGVGRALVWVFDADDPFADTGFDDDGAASPLGGEPLGVLELFGDSPRALAVSPDGTQVYAAIFLSGNRTTVVTRANVALYGGLPQPPPDSPYYDSGYDPTDDVPDLFPTTSLIVRFDPGSGRWVDDIDRDWAAVLRLSLPDKDVFTIDANATPPALVPGGTVTGVGTVIYDLAVRPGSGRLFASNTEAINHVRFTPLIDATHGVQGRFVDNRITVIDGTRVRPVGLNPHADHSRPTGSAEEVAQSLALPVGLAFSADGRWLYVTALGSERVAIVDADALEAGTLTRTLVPVGRGPTGVVVDPARDRLYVLNRFDQTISIVTAAAAPGAARETGVVRLGFDPSPSAIHHGRSLLFEGRFSGHGDVACGSCHVFGDFDGLAWDLGDPYGALVPNPNIPNVQPWHPMKGPKTTQSLRDMAGAGPMHWRGDRTAASVGGDPLDEDGAFKQFNPAFEALLGSPRQLTEVEMQAFTDWVLTIRYPPNPVAGLDGVATAAEVRGGEFSEPCQVCHELPLGTKGNSVTLGGPSVEGLKIPHLRNLYAKIGMFGQQDLGPLFRMPYLGDQVRGFGFFSDGGNAILELPLLLEDAETQAKIPDVKAFLLAFATGLAPAVGQQISATPASVGDAATIARRDLLLARADAGDCDLVVRGDLGGEARGGLYVGAGEFAMDRAADPRRTVADLWATAAATGAEQVYTCVPPGSGPRIGLDRDEDGHRDRDELDAGTSPVDPIAYPRGPQIVPVRTTKLRMLDATATADGSRCRFRFGTQTVGEVAAHRIAPPTVGSAGDPTIGGATLRVFNTAGSGEQLTLPLPASGWTATGGGYRFRDRSGPVSHVRVKQNRLAIRGGLGAFTYTLDEPAQRRMAVRLTLGHGVDWCTEVPPRPTSDGSSDRVDLFEARNAPAPGECPVPPVP